MVHGYPIETMVPILEGGLITYNIANEKINVLYTDPICNSTKDCRWRIEALCIKDYDSILKYAKIKINMNKDSLINKHIL